MEAAETLDLFALKRELKAELKEVDGFEGIGIGDKRLRVYIRDETVRERIPAEYRGVPVECVVTGKIIALEPIAFVTDGQKPEATVSIALYSNWSSFGSKSWQVKDDWRPSYVGLIPSSQEAAADDFKVCEWVFYLFNRDDRPNGKTAPSCSIGDLLAIFHDEDERAPTLWACQTIGWGKITPEIVAHELGKSSHDSDADLEWTHELLMTFLKARTYLLPHEREENEERGHETPR